MECCIVTNHLQSASTYLAGTYCRCIRLHSAPTEVPQTAASSPVASCVCVFLYMSKWGKRELLCTLSQVPRRLSFARGATFHRVRKTQVLLPPCGTSIPCNLFVGKDLLHYLAEQNSSSCNSKQTLHTLPVHSQNDIPGQNRMEGWE